MSKKIGLYIYTGDGIADAIDVNKLVELATGELNVPVVKTHDNLYSPEGAQMVKADVENEGVNAVILAGLSPRYEFKDKDQKKNLFDFPGVLVEKVGLRELVAWSHPIDPNAEDAEKMKEHVQELAEDYIRMYVAKMEKANMPEPYKMEQINQRILVIGGGVTGMTAALEAADAGYQVTIVEREGELGGHAAKFRKQIPVGPDYSTLANPIVNDLISKVQANDKIDVKTSTEIARIGGVPGEFRISLKEAGTTSEWDAPVPLTDEEKLDENGNELSAEDQKKKYDEKNAGRRDYMEVDPSAEIFGAIVLASGWKPYVPEEGEYPHLAWGHEKVVTNYKFEEMAKSGTLKGIKSVAFVLSPGGKDDDADFPYSSHVTSLVALKQAKLFREDNGDGKAYVFYQHMRTPGQYEYFYKGLQDDPGIFLTKGAVTEVKDNGSGGLIVNVENTILGEDISVDVDMVVLATGMVPTTKDEAVVNLAYRQGPAFRDLDLFGGYCDSNFICFPYETRRTGIYAAGGVRRSLTIEECMEDATGAALKAIQCLKAIEEGHAVHPRTWDYDFPDFYFQRCTQCKRCTEECPFGALDDDEKGTPKPNPTRCRRCGTCMGACPERIIGFKDYNIDIVGSMIKAIEVPDDDEEKLRMIIFACENDAYPALDAAARKGHFWSPLVRIIPVRCLGSVNVAWIKDAMSSGMDGALLLGCRYGDDYQCHFVKGSELANRRMENVAETLNSLGMEPERVKLAQIAIDEFDKVPEIINEFVEEVVGMGPNPFKGW